MVYKLHFKNRKKNNASQKKNFLNGLILRFFKKCFIVSSEILQYKNRFQLNTYETKAKCNKYNDIIQYLKNFPKHVQLLCHVIHKTLPGNTQNSYFLIIIKTKSKQTNWLSDWPKVTYMARLVQCKLKPNKMYSKP